MQKACFGCGSTEHLLKDCPKNPQIQNVEDEAPEVLFIGNVQNRKEEEGPAGRLHARSCEKADFDAEGEEPV